MIWDCLCSDTHHGNSMFLFPYVHQLHIIINYFKKKHIKHPQMKWDHYERAKTNCTTRPTSSSNNNNNNNSDDHRKTSDGSNKQTPTGNQTNSWCKMTGPNQNWRDDKPWSWEWRKGDWCGERDGTVGGGAWGTCPSSAPLVAEGYLTPPPGRD